MCEVIHVPKPFTRQFIQVRSVCPSLIDVINYVQSDCIPLVSHDLST